MENPAPIIFIPREHTFRHLSIYQIPPHFFPPPLLPQMPPRTRPIEKFASCVAQCSAEASVYGKCIVADFNGVHKDKCLKEFMLLKECYIVGALYVFFQGIRLERSAG